MTEIIIHSDVRTRFDSMGGDVAAALLMGEPIVATRRMKHAGNVYQAGDIVPTFGKYSGDWKMCQVGGGRRYVATKAEYDRSKEAHQRRQQKRDNQLAGAQEKYQDHQRMREAGRVAELKASIKEAKVEIGKLKRKETAIRKSRDAILKDEPQPYESDYKRFRRDELPPANVKLDAASSAVGRAQREFDEVQAALAETKAELAAFD